MSEHNQICSDCLICSLYHSLIFDYHYAIVIVHIPNRKHVMNGDAKASNDKGLIVGNL